MNPEEFITALNRNEGYRAQLWEKHGLTRVYLNRVNGKKCETYLNVVDGVVDQSIKNWCPVKWSDLLELVTSSIVTSSMDVEKDDVEEEDPIIWQSHWKPVSGGGSIRYYRTKGGYEGFETRNVNQHDLDDFLG